MYWNENVAQLENDLKWILADECMFNSLTVENSRAREVLELRLHNNLTYEEIANKYDVTRERVRQIYWKALVEIKLKIRTRLDDYKTVLEITNANRQLTDRLRELEIKELTPYDPATNDIKIARIDTISARAKNVLKHIGVETLNDLSQWTKSDLIKCRNFGLTTLADLEKALVPYGIELKTGKKS